MPPLPKLNGLKRDVGGCLLIALAAAAIQLGDGFLALERPLRDAGFRVLRMLGPHPVANDLVLVAIDEAFLEATPEPLTLIHPYLGRVLSGLAAVKPAVVGLDLVLPSKSYRDMQSARVKDYDLALLTGLLALSNVSPVVLSETWDALNGRFRPIFPSFVAVARRNAKGDTIASPVVCEDPDDVVRSYPGRACQPTTAAVPQAARMAEQLGNVQDWSGEINFALGNPMRAIPLGDVLKWIEAGDLARMRESFAGKSVLIGGAFSFEDRHTLPVALSAAEPGEHKIPGLFLQAQIWRSLMNGGLAHSLPQPFQALFVGAGALAMLGRTRPAKLIFCLAAVAGLLAVALFSLGAWTVVLPLGGLLAVLATALSVRGIADLLENLKARRDVTNAFAGYVGPQVLRAIERGQLRPDLSGELRQVCLLYADIRGFTEASQRLAADELVQLVNRYFAAVSPAIQEAGGMIDKYFGDGLLAIFGAPQVLDDPVRRALEAAQEMLLGVRRVNGELAAAGRTPLDMGIAIHYGDVVVGHLGTLERHEYTAVGPTVIAMPHIEEVGKRHPYPIVLSAPAQQAMAGRQEFADLGLHSLSEVGAMHLFGWMPRVLAAGGGA